MHPDICAFPSYYFYFSKLLSGPDMIKSRHAEWHSHDIFPPYIFFNIKGSEQISKSKSAFNFDEIQVILNLLKLISLSFGEINFVQKIGGNYSSDYRVNILVITFYKTQASKLKEELQRTFGRNILESIEVNTVDGFQGQEKDIILLSCVRSGRGLGFITDMRRLVSLVINNSHYG